MKTFWTVFVTSLVFGAIAGAQYPTNMPVNASIRFNGGYVQNAVNVDAGITANGPVFFDAGTTMLNGNLVVDGGTYVNSLTVDGGASINGVLNLASGCTGAGAINTGCLTLVAGRLSIDAGLEVEQLVNYGNWISNRFSTPTIGNIPGGGVGFANPAGTISLYQNQSTGLTTMSHALTISGAFTVAGNISQSGASSISSGSGGFTSTGAGFNSTATSGNYAFYTTNSGAKTCMSAGADCFRDVSGTTSFDTTIAVVPTDGGATKEFVPYIRNVATPQVIEQGRGTLTAGYLGVTFNTPYSASPSFCSCTPINATTVLGCNAADAGPLGGAVFGTVGLTGEIFWECRGPK